jgi:hypothetical protein
MEDGIVSCRADDGATQGEGLAEGGRLAAV